jgi:hypothetical protein
MALFYLLTAWALYALLKQVNGTLAIQGIKEEEPPCRPGGFDTGRPTAPSHLVHAVEMAVRAEICRS